MFQREKSWSTRNRSPKGSSGKSNCPVTVSLERQFKVLERRRVPWTFSTSWVLTSQHRLTTLHKAEDSKLTGGAHSCIEAQLSGLRRRQSRFTRNQRRSLEISNLDVGRLGPCWIRSRRVVVEADVVQIGIYEGLCRLTEAQGLCSCWFHVSSSFV